MPILLLLVIAVVVVAVFFLMKKSTKKGSGFLSAKETCAICGKEVGLNRFKIGTTTDGKAIWKCPDCAKKGGLLKIDYATGKATIIENKDTEVRMKCNTCGHVYCYTYEDLAKNAELAKSAVLDSVVGVGEALGGTRLGSQVAGAKADSKLSRMVDYNKCPHCNSTNVQALSNEEWETEKKKQNNGGSSVSSADELKKFKELLDSGVISQEEFDAKKKQLLGL